MRDSVRKYVSLEPDLQEFVEGEAKRNRRSISSQIAYMLERYKNERDGGTQISMPTTDEERDAMLERIR